MVFSSRETTRYLLKIRFSLVNVQFQPTTFPIGRACKGVAAWGVGGYGGCAPPEAGDVFKKLFKKSMNNLQFFKKFQGNFAIISKIFLNFYPNFGENLEKFRNMHL